MVGGLERIGGSTTSAGDCYSHGRFCRYHGCTIRHYTDVPGCARSPRGARQCARYHAYQNGDTIPTQGPATGTTALDAETVATLIDMAAWWKARPEHGESKEPAVPDQEGKPTMPRFPNEKVNTGIRVDYRLLDGVKAKMKEAEELPFSGGHVSYLIEYLFWQYLGFDEEYLKYNPKP